MASGTKNGTLQSHFDGLTFLRFVLEVLVIFVTSVHVLEFVWKHWGIETPELVWAYTVVTGLLVMYASMFICFTRQAAYRSELDAKATQCAALEKLLLKRRQSSRKK